MQRDLDVVVVVVVVVGRRFPRSRLEQRIDEEGAEPVELSGVEDAVLTLDEDHVGDVDRAADGHAEGGRARFDGGGPRVRVLRPNGQSVRGRHCPDPTNRAVGRSHH